MLHWNHSSDVGEWSSHSKAIQTDKCRDISMIYSQFSLIYPVSSPPSPVNIKQRSMKMDDQSRFPALIVCSVSRGEHQTLLDNVERSKVYVSCTQWALFGIVDGTFSQKPQPFFNFITLSCKQKLCVIHYRALRWKLIEWQLVGGKDLRTRMLKPHLVLQVPCLSVATDRFYCAQEGQFFCRKIITYTCSSSTALSSLCHVLPSHSSKPHMTHACHCLIPKI